jgi:hypothetical protein
MKKFAFVSLAIAAALAFSPAAFADDFAYSTGSLQGVQTWTGDLANFFTVNSGLTVTSLGVFNASGSGTIYGSTDIDVAIYNVTTGVPVLVASATFAPGSYYESGYYVYQSIAPVTLTLGTYEVDAVGFDSANPNGANPNGNINNGSVAPTLNTFGGAVSYLQGFSEYSSSTTLGGLTANQTYNGSTYSSAGPGNYGFLTQSNGGYVDRWGGADADALAVYDAGSFGVPEGGTTLVLLGLAVAGLVGLRRKLRV